MQFHPLFLLNCPPGLVCVCENRYHIRYNSTVQGVHGSDSWRGPTKLQVSGYDIRKGRFPDVPAILFELFPAAPCFDFAVVLHFDTDQPAICVMCFSLYEGYSGNRRRQDLHPSSSNKPMQCVFKFVNVWLCVFAKMNCATRFMSFAFGRHLSQSKWLKMPSSS